MIKFYKYQGTGNDFVMIDDRNRSFPANDVAYINHLCDRKFGVGADGLILLQLTEAGDFYMQYFNSDGNESSMCGNGGRCFAQFIYDLGLVQTEIKFLAIDGWHLATKKEVENQQEVIALKMMDVPSYKQLGETIFELNTGSPHYVSFRSEPIREMNLVEEAKSIRYNDTYKVKGINVNYLQMLGLKDLLLRTYERGVEDETLSCGTGATAAALSSAVLNQLPAGRHQVKVEVMGGNLEVSFFYHSTENRFEDIWLIGPAKQVFQGEVLG